MSASLSPSHHHPWRLLLAVLLVGALAVAATVATRLALAPLEESAILLLG